MTSSELRQRYLDAKYELLAEISGPGFGKARAALQALDDAARVTEAAASVLAGRLAAAKGEYETEAADAILDAQIDASANAFAKYRAAFRKKNAA